MSKLRPLPCFLAVLLLCCTTLLQTGCDPGTETPQPPVKTTIADYARKSEARPPAPPIGENFEAQPRLSLFPRVGELRPEEREEGFSFWASFIEHLTRTSGVVPDQRPGSRRCWSVRGIGDLESVGYFAPLAVTPSTHYRIKAQMRTSLPENASAGIGVLEFREFLWIGDQFTAAQMKQYALSATEGVRLVGVNDWQEVAFEIETGPETRMLHLVLFREGPKSREPVLFDDLSIVPLPSNGS